MESLFKIILSVAFIISGIAVGLITAFIYYRNKAKNDKIDADIAIEKIKKEAEIEASLIINEARAKAQDESLKQKKEADRDIKEQRYEVSNLEKRILQKEKQIDKKQEFLDQKEIELKDKEKELNSFNKTITEKNEELNVIIQEQKNQLEKITSMTEQEAKEHFLRLIEGEIRQEAGKLAKRIENEAKENADKKAKELISLAINRYAGDYVAEKTISSVPIPNDEMKGRIIGREGRNIRALEAATGIDFIIDDTPEAVILSGYNPIRREIARLTLERLISDGRIHPARIEEMVKKVEKEIETTIRETGEQAAFDVGVFGMNPELIKLLGRLRFRTSYTQNVLSHSLDVAFLCGIMASELKLNPKKAKRAGLLHDIGKAADHEIEGPHAMIGADLAKKFGEAPEIVHAIAAHHEDVKMEGILAVLVQAADAISGARPGARKEVLESYIKRIENLEGIASSISGVQKSYALQAGRELRIIVESEKVNDAEAALMSFEIAKKIEEEMTYPGQIKVTVVRETRSVEFAK